MTHQMDYIYLSLLIKTTRQGIPLRTALLNTMEDNWLCLGKMKKAEVMVPVSACLYECEKQNTAEDDELL